MSISIEFYGIPRQRAGVDRWELRAATLGQALTQIAARFPTLAAECISGESLCASCAANLNGDRFVSDPATLLADGDSLLILSADAGG